MKIQDILFLLYIFVFICGSNLGILPNIALILLLIFAQIKISSKLKLDEIKLTIVILIDIGGFCLSYGAKDHLISSTSVFFGLLFFASYLASILIYIYSFILKPFFKKIK